MTVLVIDVGSSSVRALLVDDALRTVPGSIARREHTFTTHRPGAAVADPQTLREMVEKTVDAALHHPAADNITAVGMATFVGNLLGVDAHNAPVTPLFTYADTRSAPHVQLLSQQVDTQAAHQRTGSPHHTAYYPAQLHWIHAEYPEAAARATHWLDFSTYLYREWFGRGVPMSYSTASWSGLLNRETLDWDAVWLDALGMTRQSFPELADVHTAQTKLAKAYVTRWQKLQSVPFYLALGDGAAANIGSGGVSEERVVLTVGTTAALRIVTSGEVPHVPHGLWSYRVDAKHHLLGGATSEGGNIFEWAKRTLQLAQPEEVEQALRQRLPHTHGLSVLPLLTGERSPGYATHATGVVHGLRMRTTPMDILQAALEGVAVRVAIIAEMLDDTQAPIYAGGGALFASPAFAQIITNALNRPLLLLDEPEVTARGVAAVITQELSTAATPAVAGELHPMPEHAAALTTMRDKSQRLYDLMVQMEE